MSSTSRKATAHSKDKTVERTASDTIYSAEKRKGAMCMLREDCSKLKSDQ